MQCNNVNVLQDEIIKIAVWLSTGMFYTFLQSYDQRFVAYYFVSLKGHDGLKPVPTELGPHTV